MAFNANKSYIVKSISGFYYVKTAYAILECKARGVFRKNEIVPTVGDYVDISCNANENVIVNILERKNLLKRPPIANVDQLFIVVSTTEPTPNLVLADKLTTVAIMNEIEPIIVVTKQDLVNEEEILTHYNNSGIRLFVTDKSNKNITIEQIRLLLKGKLSVFTGNSGVGKTTLLNALSSDNLKLETAPISTKLGRGKHTTRAVEIFEMNDGLIADTPGFSAFDFEKPGEITKKNLQHYFPEFAPYFSKCKYQDCAHIKEKDCVIKKAVDAGEISTGRYNSYVQIYNEIKEPYI